MREAVRMVLVLTAIAFLSGSSLAFLERMTREPIEYQRLKFVKGPAVRAVLPNSENDPIKDHKKGVVLQGTGDQVVRKSLFPAKKGGKLVAVAFEVAGQGYHGDLGIMIGVDLDSGRLTGMRVMTHSETPGLGARAVEPGFYEQFSGVDPQGVALAGKGGAINAISGATITSTGVVEAVRKGLELFSQSREKIAGTFQAG